MTTETFGRPLEGLVAVVTGANRGIGFGIARSLGHGGAHVALLARDAERNRLAVEELHNEGIGAQSFTVDATNGSQIENAISSLFGDHGHVDIGVANAGGGPHASLLDGDVGQFEEGIRLNLTAAYLLFQSCARAMVEKQRPGALVAVSSCAALHAQPEMVEYAAAKAGLGGLVRTAAVELAPYGIRVNTLMPGWTQNSRFSEESVSQTLRAETLSSIPAGRWGTPHDLGRGALFLCDPSFAFHTGTELRIDGGYAIAAPYLAARKRSQM
jgi:NAD(P)-dependent dehydrogenase (short-subunit alcohol dehydrogenase family)